MQHALLIVRQIVSYTMLPCPFLAKPHPCLLIFLCLSLRQR